MSPCFSGSLLIEEPKVASRLSPNLTGFNLLDYSVEVEFRFLGAGQEGRLADLAVVKTEAGRVVADEVVSVKEGTGAIRAYQRMLHGNDEVSTAYEELLLQCCKLDTLSMVMLWYHWTER